ncbi:MAG: hypothetical protein ACI4DV_01090 [Lachnospiraceae bacterium]
MIVLIVLIVMFLVIVVISRVLVKDIEVETIKSFKDYQELLEKYEVPEEHYKIVIAQSRVHAVHNCPAVIWKDGNMVKILLVKTNPVLSECEAEELLLISSQTYVDFKQYDGSEYPNWAAQSKEIKEMFLPYVEMSNTFGGLDYDRQIYWAGTICVYSKSLAEIFKMMGRPVKDYHMQIEHMDRMMEDGSLPEDMLKELRAELAAKKKAEEAGKNSQNSAAAKEMEKRLGDLERTMNALLENQNRQGEEAAKRVNELTARLLEDGRMEELKRSTQDLEYQEKLLNEYGLL